LQHIYAVQVVKAAGGTVQAADRVHQRGFARTAGAHDGDKFAGQDFQRNAPHRVDVHLARAINLVDVCEFDDGIHGPFNVSVPVKNGGAG
jgi:hypothetical protein